MARACRLGLVGAVVLLVLSLEPVAAQVPYRQYGTTDPIIDRPALSPYYYLNSRSRSTGATNYQQWVVPQLRAMEASATQQRQIQQLQGQVAQARAQSSTGPVTTGHRTFFGNYSHFYGGSPTQPGQPGQPAFRRR